MREIKGLKPLLAERNAREGGNFVGRDPRSISMETWREAGTPMHTLAEAVWERCLDCCGFQPREVRLYMALACPLWPFRMGTDPFYGRRPGACNREPAADIRSPDSIAADTPAAPAPSGKQALAPNSGQRQARLGVRDDGGPEVVVDEGAS